MQTRREFLGSALAAGIAAGGAGAGAAAGASPGRRPNVVIVLSDDQGSGDLGCLGHPLLKTPNLDRLHGESVRLSRFYVCPVCAPTRACLMTGRYNYRTGVTDTYVGRANMDPAEATLAEALRGAGYATGIFGKWHLGDSFPLRPMDRGFEESLVLKGGGLCQPSDPRVTSYYDPILWRNGAEVTAKGYCTDLFTDAAIEFVQAQGEKPYFLYVPTNAPHTPLDIADTYAAPYRAMGAGAEDAKFYGMIGNLDENVGRLLAAIDAAGQRENTIFIFFTDNGTAYTRDGERYNAGLRGSKGTVYEGGIRVPCFVRWPGGGLAGADFGGCASVIDLMPTLLGACGAEAPRGAKFDGVNLLPSLRGESAASERALFSQWHRGDAPVAYRNAAVITPQYKLVDGKELYDLAADPGEKRDVSGEFPEVVKRLRGDYDAWFADVCATRGFAPVLFAIGSVEEPVTWLTGQDMREVDGWGPKDLGAWHVEVARAGSFSFALNWLPGKLPGGGRCVVDCGGHEFEAQLGEGDSVARITGVPLERGALRICARLETAQGKIRPEWVEVRRD